MTSSAKLLGLFPGQGSQTVGMGKSLYESNEIVKKLFEKADEVLDFSLSELCFDGPIEELSKTAHSQPAILTCSVAAYTLWKENAANSLSLAAGHSLGEYSALVAAGALNFEDAVLLVHKRGTYMQEAVPIGIGAMMAVIGVELEDLEKACNEIEGVVEIANINAPGQIVVSGEKEPVLALKEVFPDKKLVELNVSAPFHSSLMQPAAEKLAVDLDNTSIKDAEFPIIANVLAKPIVAAEDIRQALKDQVCGRVRWTESVLHAVSENEGIKGVEFGAGKVLSGLMRRINRETATEQIAA